MKSDKNREREGFLDYYSLDQTGPGEKVQFESPEEAAAHIKHVAINSMSAGAAGITKFDGRWHYSHKYKASEDLEVINTLPEGLDPASTSVIVLVYPMDKKLLQTVPSALSGTATGLGYSVDTVSLLSISQYITNLGYISVASLNDTALNIPYAIEAGLGEYGRNGLLLTPQWGPRVRLGKIFTNLPLATDRPLNFGVKSFCEQCNLCAAACPAKAIPFGPPTRGTLEARISIRNSDKTSNGSSSSSFSRSSSIIGDGTEDLVRSGSSDPYHHTTPAPTTNTIVKSLSTLQGPSKWNINPERCFKYWTSLNTDCAVCIRVCPFNRDDTMLDRLWRAGAKRSFLRGVMLKIHVWSQKGSRLTPKKWWAQADKFL
jgi:epoxyqueuosine reductase